MKTLKELKRLQKQSALEFLGISVKDVMNLLDPDDLSEVKQVEPVRGFKCWQCNLIHEMVKVNFIGRDQSKLYTVIIEAKILPGEPEQVSLCWKLGAALISECVSHLGFNDWYINTLKNLQFDGKVHQKTSKHIVASVAGIVSPYRLVFSLASTRRGRSAEPCS